jgi:ABC-type amino acid transport system permease subunit
MAVSRSGTARLASLLDLLSLQLHRDGVFAELAARNGVPADFLRTQQSLWRGAGCVGADGAPAAACLTNPVDSSLPPTRFAPAVEAAEHWLADTLGLHVTLPMLKTRAALTLFLTGLVNSLVMVAGALAATFGLTLAIAAALTARSPALRLPVRLLTLLGQSSPIVLTMFLGYVAASAMVTYSVQVAMLVAVLVIGLYNASYAGPAVAEASRALAVRHGHAVPLHLAVRHAGTQVLAFLVNAAKGCSIASVIGVPELLDSLTDIASFSSERATTFTVLLVFYSAVVGVVVWAGEAVRRRLDPPGAPA